MRMTQHPRRPTIIDVAKLAGVSTATVSRVLQAPEIVSKNSRQKVLKAVQETGYRINSAAQNLRINKSGAVLVVVPDIGNSFFSEILAGIERVASKTGYTILIGDTGGDSVRCQKLLDLLRNGRADGALLLNGYIPPLDYDISEIAAVSVSEVIEGANIPHVGTDNFTAAKDATNALVAHGHQRITHISGPEGNFLTKERILGYQTAMKEANLADHIDIISAGFSAESGRDAATKILKSAKIPSALFCANDETAMGVISQLIRSGLSVPDDVSVCGFDDIHLAETFIPQISTIKQARFEIGQEAMRQLLELFIAKPKEILKTYIPHHYLPRESTKQIK